MRKPIPELPPSYSLEMLHFLKDDFQDFYWLLVLGLHETIHIRYDNGTDLRRSYFQYYMVYKVNED